MITTLIILALTIIMFIVGKLRSDIVALCALAALLITGILTPTEALAGFSSSVVIMMAGLFVVGGAILQTGLAKAASQRILKVAAGNDLRLFLLVVLTTAAIGAFVSNTGTVALMMPIVVSMSAQSGTKPSRLLMPLAFASSLGGMLTLIGTPPNLVISETLGAHGFEELEFFSFLPVGIICIVVGILVMLPLTKLFLYNKKSQGGGKRKNTKSLDQLVDEYQLKGNVHSYRVNRKSSINGKTVAELDLTSQYGLTIVEIRRENVAKGGLIRSVQQSLASPKTIIREDDILYLTGDVSGIDKFAADARLKKMNASTMDFYDIGISEIVLMPNSQMVDSSLKKSNFRAKYNLNVLGIKRGDKYITADLPDVRLKAGDVLLVQGKWSNIANLGSDADEWVALGEPEKQASQVTLDYKAPLAAIIMLAMIAAMVFDFIPIAPVTAVIVAGLLMVICGCFRNVEAAYKTINWESLVLIAAMMPMSTALDKTGTSAMISQSLVEALGAMSPWALLAGIYFTTSLLTMFISNTATAVLMSPIAMTAALQMGISPYPLLFAVTLGASMCFASPFATPPNALVMHAGEYTFGDYIKVGLPLQLIMGIVMTFVLPLLFPF